jgi:small GTP-binding protein
LLLEILDTAGQEEYKALRDNYMRKAHGFLVVYSVVEQKTFEEVGEFHAQILRVKDKDNFPMVFVGNKSDLESERTVHYDEGMNFAKQKEVGFIETSARARRNVDEAFHLLVKEVRKFQGFNKKDEEKKGKQNPKKSCLIL